MPRRFDCLQRWLSCLIKIDPSPIPKLISPQNSYSFSANQKTTQVFHTTSSVAFQNQPTLF
jgi:hypothetical protein